ncbi:response regulator [Marivita sp.]|uniref:response regulator n=1 Tax=Marivita sp. TaxID=2003365 RepID=UPI0025B89EB0|nr:response regulator [Marivita sp.]
MAKILVVDDDPDVGDTVVAMLACVEHDVTFESRSARSISLLAETGFDLVICDLFMPDCDGIELILEIKRMSSQTRIIMMTGGARLFPPGSNALSDITTSAEMLGADSTIRKPFRRQQLVDAVSELV